MLKEGRTGCQAGGGPDINSAAVMHVSGAAGPFVSRYGSWVADPTQQLLRQPFSLGIWGVRRCGDSARAVVGGHIAPFSQYAHKYAAGPALSMVLDNIQSLQAGGCSRSCRQHA